MMTMTAQATSPASSGTHTPRKLNVDEDDDDDDEDRRGLLAGGGPFENAKRKSSWSATSMRKELGSPRMVSSTTATGHEPPFPFDSSPPPSSHVPTTHSTTTAAAAATTTSSNPNVVHRQPPQSSATSSSGNDLHHQSRGGGGGGTKKTRSCGPSVGANFLQELGSALVSCGGGRGDSNNNNTSSSNTPSSTTNDKSHAEDTTNNMDLMNAAGTSWVLLKDSIHKAVKGDLHAAKEAWRRGTQSLDLSTADEYYNYYNYVNPTDIQSVTSQDDSILTYDNNYAARRAALLQQQQEEDEAMQLRRLTSWGTVGTYETLEVQSAENATPNIMRKNGKGQTQPQKHSVTNSNTRRKRVVRFDYPPISSLRECPRTQPDQIGDLFFTEHELEQIEDDRYSTISADDVEIVAISTSTTAESETETPSGRIKSTSLSPRHPPEGDDTPSSSSHFRNYVSTPSTSNRSHKKESKKGGRMRNFSFDEKRTNQPQLQRKGSRHRGGSSSTLQPSTSNITDGSTTNNTNTSTSSPVSVASSKRMIKSVQIYLRERSVG